MHNKNPIVIIDDDDDSELLRQVFTDLEVQNEIIFFNNGYDFLNFVKETQSNIFFILCDMNMSQINGLELKKLIYDANNSTKNLLLSYPSKIPN